MISRIAMTALAMGTMTVATAQPASAKSCEQLRALCHTMRDDKNDCTKPYQRCLTTGTFITPLGRVCKATK